MLSIRISWSYGHIHIQIHCFDKAKLLMNIRTKQNQMITKKVDNVNIYLHVSVQTLMIALFLTQILKEHK